MLWKEQIEHLCGLWHKTPETAIFLIFFVKWRFISIASNLDIWHPVWRPTHDIADGFVIDILTTFDNEFIMDMTADKAVGEVTHGKTEKVPGDCLHDVLYEFRTVAFDSFPFLSGADTFIGYGFTTESIFSDTRLDVAKSSTRRKFDEEYPTSTEEFDSVYLCRNLHFDSSLYGIIYIPPEGSNIWIGGTPGVNQWLQFIFH